ncbi:type II secretion system protein GspG [Hyalangium sp.]|uniref:type II secretion system protein GspG n=1 Tax=Hyalangium sp. TaxID=2028555 RepID=UPI002D568693|nr:type II secretion system protein GspG [Hyalangium sp.]HYH96166.1 type II secretion system protein GspG [Hyalangium sp.]
MSEDTARTRRLAPLRFFLGLAVGLCLVVTTVLFAFRHRGDESWVRIHQDFAVIGSALERYRAEKGALPEDDSLGFLVPEYLPAVPVDPWGRPYVYLNNGKQPLLITFGRDGERGGQGVEQDHSQVDGHTR